MVGRRASTAGTARRQVWGKAKMAGRIRREAAGAAGSWPLPVFALRLGPSRSPLPAGKRGFGGQGGEQC